MKKAVESKAAENPLYHDKFVKEVDRYDDRRGNFVLHAKYNLALCNFSLSTPTQYKLKRIVFIFQTGCAFYYAIT